MTAPLAADYFDGQVARAHPVRLHIAHGELHIDGPEIARRVPLAEVRWPERQRHGARMAHLADGGAVFCHDSAAFDVWVRDAGIGDSLIVSAQQSWRATGVLMLALLLLALAGYLWGLPLAARAILAFAPPSLDRAIGEAALDASQHWLKPSELPAADQQRLRAVFADAVERAYYTKPSANPSATSPATPRPTFEVRFHKSVIGPNAFALPGDTIVITDELVKLLDGRDDVLVGVFAHEFGHLRHRHGMRSLVQVTLLGAITSVAFGDFSALLAAAPALLGQAAYSRDFEREADAESVAVLRAAGLSPEVMIVFFDKLRQRLRDRSSKPAADEDPAVAIGIGLASHPADEERIRFFRDAARR